MNSIIALCVGHSRQVNDKPEGGAVTHDGSINEWTWNSTMARHIAGHLLLRRVQSVIVDRYEGRGYATSMQWLAEHLKDRSVTAALELHFNRVPPSAAHGHEWLYWHSSKAGRRLAENLEQEMCFGVPQIKTRGIKPKYSSDRGALFLRGTHCPAVICEPFFGSNPGDWQTAKDKKTNIARAIAEGILEYLM